MTHQKHIVHYVVEPFQEDLFGCMSWSVLGNLLLRTANFHAHAHGFGLEYVRRTHWAWVLSRLVIDMQRMPESGEHFTITTWVSRVYRQFSNRNYCITSDDGTVLGYATSVWALIDYEKRIPVDGDSLPGGGLRALVVDEVPPIDGQGRVKVSAEQPVRLHRVAYSDMDINGHVNSVRYIDFAIDCIPVPTLAAKRIKRVEMTYAVEAMAGESLAIYAEQDADEAWGVEIRKEAGGVIAKAKLCP